MNLKEKLEKLNNEYLLKQKRAEIFADKMIEKARSDKAYFTLELEERNLILDISKLNFLKKDSAELQKKLNTIKKLKEDRLNELNIPFSSLKPKYECSLCNDTGRTNGGYCPCFIQAYNNLQMQESKIDFENLPNLKDYNLSLYNKQEQEQMQKILNICKKWLNNFSSKINHIIFSGFTGVGKTYLSKVLAKEVMIKGYSTYYTTAFQLNTQMLKYHTTFTEEKEKLLENLLESDYLIIDDLGTEPVLKNITQEYLLLILTERNINNKKTIINTNLAPTHILERYGERIFSRLMNKQTGLLLKLDGDDLRLKKQA